VTCTCIGSFPPPEEGTRIDARPASGLKRPNGEKEYNWPKAVSHARWARALEFACGRAVRRDGRLTWGPFCRIVEAAAGASATAGCPACGI